MLTKYLMIYYWQKMLTKVLIKIGKKIIPLFANKKKTGQQKTLKTTFANNFC